MTHKNLLFSLLLFMLASTASSQNSPWSLAFQNDSGNYYSIFSLDKNRLFTTGELGVLYKSTDGAQTVQRVPLDSNLSLYYDIIFPDSQHGIAGGGCYFPFGECRENVVAITNDGGQTWQVEQITAANVGTLGILDYLPDGTVYAMGDYAGLYRRNPQSSTWDSLGRPDDLVAGAYLGMQFLDANNGFVEYWTTLNGSNGVVLMRTLDGGLSWQQVYSTGNSGDGPNFFFLTPLNGFQLANNGQLGRSSDGGFTWNLEQTFAATEDIRKIDFVDPEVGYLITWENATQKGRIYRSGNGGDTWALDVELDSVYFLDFHFSDQENGFAVADYNKIYKRSGMVAVQEAGKLVEWQAMPNPFNDKIYLQHASGKEKCTLLNTLGHVIWTGVGIEQQDFSGLKAGVYFLKMEGERPVVQKMVKHR